MLDWGLAALPESKMKERETVLAEKHVFVLISRSEARINVSNVFGALFASSISRRM